MSSTAAEVGEIANMFAIRKSGYALHGKLSTVATTERWSKTLFSSVHLLSVAAAIGRADADDDVTSQTLQSQLSLAQSTVYRALSVLEEVKLLERLDRTSRTDSVRFHRVDHAFWAATRDLAATAEALT